MNGIKVTLTPNIENDYQSFSIEDLGLSAFEWFKMSGDDQRILVLEHITENIYSFVESIEEY